ncbi:MAG: glycine cleavage system aminomethyltransferase GcvT [bacterium]
MPNTPVPQKTPLYDEHLLAGGRMVDFAGWMMPVNYGSQIEEHSAVRSDVGMFDVSHMTIIDVKGADALAFLQKLVANDVGRLSTWGALYGALLNENGGVLDDLIVYALPEGYRCVVNASTRGKVLAWFEQHKLPAVSFAQQPLVMIAVQGPNAIERLNQSYPGSVPADLAPFTAAPFGQWMVGRTGYTGEDGVEVMLPAAEGIRVWQQLRAAGVQPAGLGARDTLRLEAGLNLYGQDLDEQTSPLASNIAWTIAWSPQERDFIGRSAIEPERGRCPMKLTGLIMKDKGVLRQGQVVTTSAGNGIITSGTFSPTLGFSIALARLPKAASGACEVDIRGKARTAEIVKPPFVRHGKSQLVSDV